VDEAAEDDLALMEGIFQGEETIRKVDLQTSQRGG
jgi:hypothetical protein